MSWPYPEMGKFVRVGPANLLQLFLSLIQGNDNA